MQASSPSHVFSNCTNTLTSVQTKLAFKPSNSCNEVLGKPHTPYRGLGKRKLDADFRPTKKFGVKEGQSDSDVEMEDVAAIRVRPDRYPPFHARTRAAMSIPGSGRREQLYTRAILQSFVSSHKSDVFKCESTDVNAYLTPPYACSYSNSAKRGGTPILAVATEQGTVHLVNTSRRADWDPQPPRTTLELHDNGIFDVAWNNDDTLLATCSGDKSTRISSLTSETVMHVLRAHTSTVKCATWHPSHKDLLSTGGRDGMICVWDLRVRGGKGEDSLNTLAPVINIAGAHEDETKVKRRRCRKGASTARSVTDILYPDIGSHGLISSGSFNGVLKYWDLRTPTTPKKSSPAKVSSLYTSPVDPTTTYGSRRPRGIIRMSAGSGPTAGLAFGLGADSRVHTYSLPSLAVIDTDYVHDSMQTSSFYTGMSVSPCGRWLATGSGATKNSPQGSAFLFDVSNAATAQRSWKSQAVQLKSQQGEVSAVDWAEGMLASCADDGTVRMWRPDIERYRACMEQPEESRWDWDWAL